MNKLLDCQRGGDPESSYTRALWVKLGKALLSKRNTSRPRAGCETQSSARRLYRRRNERWKKRMLAGAAHRRGGSCHGSTL
ncbi:hypothetical protein EJ06DRAFT_527995, partial [Trichodelitschia bisporula]